MKINGQTPTSKEVKTKQTIDTCTWWQGVAQHWKPRPFLPQSHDPVDHYTRRKLNTASCGHLNAVRHQRRVVADSNQYADIHHRARRSGVDGKTEYGTPSRSPQFRAGNDQSLLRVEGKGHKTMAVPCGIFPVYRMANRLGRNATALR